MRKSDALIAQNTGYNLQSQSPMVNVVGSGQQGIVTDLSTYISNAAYVRRNLICLVLQTPRGFNLLPDSAVWHATCKNLLENGSRTIEGLRKTLTVEYVSNPIGAAGEQQEDIAKVNRERSTPTHVFTEKYGKPINRFFDAWIRLLIADPETGIPAITSLGLSDGPADQLPDFTSMTCLYIEPDPLHKTVVEAYLVTNMMPKTAGQVESSRDITASGQSVDYTIEFTGITQVGAGVNQFAQSLLDQMNLTGVNPNRRQAFVQQVDAFVKDSNGGYENLVQQVANEQITG